MLFIARLTSFLRYLLASQSDPISIVFITRCMIFIFGNCNSFSPYLIEYSRCHIASLILKNFSFSFDFNWDGVHSRLFILILSPFEKSKVYSKLLEAWVNDRSKSLVFHGSFHSNKKKLHLIGYCKQEIVDLPAIELLNIAHIRNSGTSHNHFFSQFHHFVFL